MDAAALSDLGGKDTEGKYIGELRGLYASLTPTQTSDNQWPPSCTHRVFNLAMVKEEQVQRGHIKDQFVRMTITGKLDDILHVKYPISLENIFKDVEPSKRKVVLIEGAPGCGKSTLSIFISQQWGEEKLFTEYKAVILVRLRDPLVQKAKSILELMPTGEVANLTQEAEEEMRANDFRDILFVLDGWDELPASVRNDDGSIFRTLIQEDLAKKSGLHKSAVIVTSRPVASGELQKLVSARIEILGFKPGELTEYFSDCLEGDTEAVRTLQERIEENPSIAGSCYLPLNASVLVHLFKHHQRSNLPTSQYGVFSLLICTCIQRHMKERSTHHKHLTFESLDQLFETDAVSEPFKFLCQLAYDGVMSDRITFSSLPNDVNTLSLLQGAQSFLKHTQKVMSYNFIHLSIQELLAAFFMVKSLKDHEQVDKFKQLFDNPRFNAVFNFYAAITKLQTPGMSSIITKIAELCSEQNPNEKAKILLVTLFHCLYEAQDRSLFNLIMQNLQHGLNLGHTSLNQTDCLCIGYFLSHACCATHSPNEFKINLFNCNAGDQGCKYLVRGMLKCLDKSGEATEPTLHLNLRWNGIHEEGSIELCRALKSGCIRALNLNGNDEFSDEGARHLALELEANTSLEELNLYTCGLKAEGLGRISKSLMTNNTLTVLNVGGNGLYDEGIEHLAHALTFNHSLKSLNVSSCGMTDVGLRAIADSLEENDTLTELKLFNFQNQPHLNEFRDDGGSLKYLTESLKQNHTLCTLYLPADFKAFVFHMQASINGSRTLIDDPGVKPIKVDCKSAIHTYFRLVFHNFCITKDILAICCGIKLR